MDLDPDSGTVSSHAALEEPSLTSSHSQTGSGGAILLQLLEFKTHLHDVVEELHIRRDAEIRFEDQISQLVLEKQELEWEKESLQQQAETMTKQHTESLTATNKQFQDKLQHLEEEKGKYQVTAELKDKEINNLKEELKSLQLLKYNLEKKSSELEQKLALQSRIKDTHLNQLGEVEKRFRVLSRQCVVVKQAHEKLEQNVDEAMRINNKLTSANQNQEEIIVTLKKELEEVRNKLIKEKMKSVINEKSCSPTVSEQHLQEQQQKLHLETEMNKKLREENTVGQVEKLELVRSLQENQLLLLNQTQTVRKLEAELQTQTELYQALKQEHEMMREKSKTMEDKVVQLTESYSASQTSWDQEKNKFLDQLKNEQEDLQVLKEAYEDLQQKHAELSEQTRSQAQHSDTEEVIQDTISLCVSTNQFTSMLEDTRDEETSEAPVSSSHLQGFISLQHSVSSQAENSDHLRNTGAARAGGGQPEKCEDMQSPIQQPQGMKHILEHPKTFSVTNIDCLSLLKNPTSATQMKILEENLKKCETSDLIVLEGHQSASNPEWGSGDLLNEDPYGEKKREMNENGQRRTDTMKQENHRELEETTAEKEFIEEDGKNAEEKHITTQTAQGTSMDEDIKGSANTTEETSNCETEIRDKKEGELTDGVKETAEHTTPETLIAAFTTTDTTGNSLTLQVNDSMDTNLPLTVCEPSNSSESLSQKVTDDRADCNHSNKELTVNRKECRICSDKLQSFSIKSSSDAPDVQPGFSDEVQTSCQDADPLNNQQRSPVCQNHEHENSSRETAGGFSAESTEILKPSNTNTCQENDSVQVCKTSQTQTETWNPSCTLSIMKKTDETFDECVSEECVLMTNVMKSQPQSQETSEQRRVQHLQLHGNTCETSIRDTVQIPAAVTMEVAATVKTKEETKTDKLRNTEDEEATRTQTDLKVSDELLHENRKETGSLKRHHLQTLKQMKLSDSTESSLNTENTSRKLFESSIAQRKPSSSRTNPDDSKHQWSHVFGLSQMGRPLSTLPTFLKSKQNKVASVISRSSDLYKPSGVSGAAAGSRIHQQEEKLRDIKEETCRETSAGDTNYRDSSSFGSFRVSGSGSKVSWLTSSACSRSAAGPCSESDQEPSSSQDCEDQQSSFRAQILKIEQFLNTERLRLPKKWQAED